MTNVTRAFVLGICRKIGRISNVRDLGGKIFPVPFRGRISGQDSSVAWRT